MAVSTVLPHITATYSGVYPASTVVGTVPVISANSVRASVLVYLSPIDSQLTLQFSPTVDIGGTFGSPSVTIPSTPMPLYNGVEFTYTFTVSGNVQAAAAQAVAWTAAIVTATTTAITAMRTTDASITFPPGSTITTV